MAPGAYTQLLSDASYIQLVFGLQLVTLGKQSVSVGLDGRWYAEHAAGDPEWDVVFTVTLLFPQ